MGLEDRWPGQKALLHIKDSPLLGKRNSVSASGLLLLPRCYTRPSCSSEISRSPSMAALTQQRAASGCVYGAGEYSPACVDEKATGKSSPGCRTKQCKGLWKRYSSSGLPYSCALTTASGTHERVAFLAARPTDPTSCAYSPRGATGGKRRAPAHFPVDLPSLETKQRHATQHLYGRSRSSHGPNIAVHQQGLSGLQLNSRTRPKQ